MSRKHDEPHYFRYFAGVLKKEAKEKGVNISDYIRSLVETHPVRMEKLSLAKCKERFEQMIEVRSTGGIR